MRTQNKASRVSGIITSRNSPFVYLNLLPTLISCCLSYYWNEELIMCRYKFSSVQFSCSVVSDSLWPHELQHVRLPCPSPTPGVYPNSCPFSRWCHLTILSCHPLFLLPSILPNIRVFSNKSTLHIRWPKYWSFSFNISPSNFTSDISNFLLSLLQFNLLSQHYYPYHAQLFLALLWPHGL